MGGTVAVTIRFEDGTVEPMGRWTNSLPGFFQDVKFVKKDQSHLDEYLRDWFEMKDDWDKNHKSGRFEFPMTPCYGNWRHIAPTGYGLVVIDYKTETILSMQGYSSLNTFHSSRILMNNNESREEIAEAIKHFVENGHAYYILRTDFEGLHRKKYIGTIEEFIIWNEKNWHEIFQIEFDLTPWKIIHIDETQEGAKAFFEKLIELDFDIPEADQNYWKEWIDEYDAYEDIPI